MKAPLSSFLIILSSFCQLKAANLSDLTYSTYSGSVTITDCKTTAAGDLTIPSVISGLPVTTIGFRAFKDCTNLNAVFLPDSVTSIGSEAFFGCTGMTSIVLPDALPFLRSDIFSGCTNLTTITLPDTLTSIGTNCFSECTSLITLTLPPNITSVGSRAFYNCSRLQSVTLPQALRIIRDSAFSGCSSLTSISLPASLSTIEMRAFARCDSLQSIAIPDSIERIENGTFSNCSNLTTVSMPSSLEYIGDYAFYACSSLRTIMFPASLYNIRQNAFSDCVSLSAIFFSGDAPYTAPTTIFNSAPATAYIKSSAQGFGDIFAGVPVKRLDRAIYNILISTGQQLDIVSSTTNLENFIQATGNALATERSSGQLDVINAPENYGLLTESQLHALALGDAIIAKDLDTGTFTITLDMKHSIDLSLFHDLDLSPHSVQINADGDIQIVISQIADETYYLLEF